MSESSYYNYIKNHNNNNVLDFLYKKYFDIIKEDKYWKPSTLTVRTNPDQNQKVL